MIHVGVSFARPTIGRLHDPKPGHDARRFPDPVEQIAKAEGGAALSLGFSPILLRISVQGCRRLEKVIGGVDQFLDLQ